MTAKPIHALIDGRVLCGVTLTESVFVVPPQLAKHVTCRRCLASLNGVGK